ncbi:MAG TPA: hypothetical protein VJI97_04890 [Candidatus Nanoarchaeia archaeon]|nr:hypothetical protein [Candidatus Nanoarchaeia archaeon]
MMTINVFAIPTISSTVVLSTNPNAGQDLLCNYTYTSLENYTEQNSSFNWYKNGIGQGINSAILSKNNLSVNVNWSCEVAGYDGVDFSTPSQSSNVTILSTVSNVSSYVNGTQVNNEEGYFGSETSILNLTQQLSDSLEDCTPDDEGFCNVSMIFSSDSTGLLNISDLGVYYLEDKITSLNIESINTIYKNETLTIFEFIIFNDGSFTVNNIQWQFDTGDSYIVNSTSNISSLTAGEKAFVYVQYNYSGEGSFSINASAIGISQNNKISGSMLESLEIGNLLITSFDAVNVDAAKAIFEIHAKDIAEEAISSINWSLDTGKDSIITSGQQYGLSPGETIFIFVQHDYAGGGTYNPTAYIASASHSNSKATSVTLQYININNLAALNESGNNRIFGFDIENGLSSNLTKVNWTLDTRNSNIINATSNVILQPAERIFVYIDYNYTQAGAYNVNATAKNGTLIDARNLTIII